ncbi:LysR substrate-binding domain-containing protein [Leucobacter tenebrionis]|uniref:LysR substrate-binding domain-containing protein n=1 Tax=Leucobacter tenebrionis TaxID=2873270 RepID=UPI001CA6CE90|nr:LysR substrate-binding domain-containing protein [Leucobacter tenebrionis]QZY50618.1 LysR family transcriptional regulator [Leucobacter tenebrionis]
MDTREALDLSRRLPSLPFTLRQIECFLAVADSGSISGAAAALHASDSAVSDALTAMERALGASLFKRQRSRGATLTSDGLTILPLARRIVTDGAELTASVGREQSSIVGPVRIGLINTLASLILPRLLIATRQNYPGVHIEYRTGDLGTMLSAAEGAELDLVVTFDIEVPPEYERVALTTTEAMLVVSEEHPLASRDSVDLSEVAEEPMIMLDIAASRTHTLEIMSSRGITPRIAHRTADYELCRALVGRGLGYTLLMRRNVSPETWDGRRVVYLPIVPAPRPVEVLVAWPQNPLPPRVAAVVDCAKQLRGEMMTSLGDRLG